jgi:hypothetical protein
MLVHGVGTLFYNSGFDMFINKAKIRMQQIGLLSW